MRSWEVCRWRRHFAGGGHALICAGLVSLGSCRDAGKSEDNQQSLPEVCCERMELATDRESDLVGFDGRWGERFRPDLTVMRCPPPVGTFCRFTCGGAGLR